MKENKKPLDERLIQFGVSVAIIAESFPENKFGNQIRDQIIRSCTSPALNYGEAQAAESRKDFIHKMKVCLKELKETNHSLRLMEGYLQSSGNELKEIKPMIQESQELIYIFYRSIKTAMTNAMS